jgi:serine/threonine-protein kinase LATS1/2
MGQQPRPQLNMNPSAPARSPGYHQKAMEEIQNSLRPFAKSGGEAVGSSAASTISNFSATSGISSLSSTSGTNGTDKDVLQLRHTLSQLINMGYSEDVSLRALQLSNSRLDGALDYLMKQQIDPGNKCGYTKLIRKPSIERELVLPRGSPALDSGAGSSRSDSPRLTDIHSSVSRYSPNFSEPPPPPPPRNTPPPPPPPHVPSSYPALNNVQQLLKRMSPAPIVPARAPPAVPSYNSPALQQRGTSPVSSVSSSSGRQPMVVQNGPQVQQQLSQQIQALSLYQSSSASTAEPPPPYPLIPQSPSNAPPPPPSYSASIQNRHSPTQDFRKSPSSGIYSGSTSAGSPSPIPVSTTTPPATARPTPLHAWGARQAKTQPPIIMQSVKSTQVQKPVLQTAVAPTSPQIPTSPTSTSPLVTCAPPPSYTASIQQKGYTSSPKPAAPLPAGVSPAPANNATSVIVPTTEPPSYASTMQAKAKAQRGMGLSPHPPPPYLDESHAQVNTVECAMSPRASPNVHPPLQRKYSPVVSSECVASRSDSPQSTSSGDSRPSYPDNGAPPLPPTGLFWCFITFVLLCQKILK